MLAFFLGVAGGTTVKVIRVIKSPRAFASFKEFIDGAVAGLPPRTAYTTPTSNRGRRSPEAAGAGPSDFSQP